MIRRSAAFGVCLLAAVTAGCGGADYGRTKDSLEQVEEQDVGSTKVLCDAASEYELLTLQDFETESVSGGWYFNNDQCDKCQDIIDRIKEINNLLLKTGIRLEWSPEDTFHVDKWGCNDRSFTVDAEAAQQRYAAEVDELARKLIEGDPANNVPPMCESVCEKSQTPNPRSKPILASPIQFYAGEKLTAQPRCNSKSAMHVKGGPFATWGGSVAVQFPSPGLDASAWDGLAFWARVGPTSRHPLRVEISDVNTDDKQMIYTFPGDAKPSFVTVEDLVERDDHGNIVGLGHFDAEGDNTTWCSLANPKNAVEVVSARKQVITERFVCNGDSLREDRNGCDKFGANRSMTGDWQFFSIDFSMMRQSGWGKPAKNPDGDPVGLTTSQIRSIAFMWTTGTWDVWLDDVALYRRKQP